ncbi:hypothetical protein NFI96_033074, partial [Prochilodus magdalenae]
EDYRSIRWHRLGTCMVIDVDLFKAEILSRQGEAKIFETTVMKSFMRQLNLYGFKKIQSLESASKEEVFYNGYFRQGHPELLIHVSRRLKVKAKQPRTTAFTIHSQTPQPDLSEKTLMDTTEVPLDACSSQNALCEARTHPDELASTAESSLESTLQAVLGNMTTTTGLHLNATQLQTTLAAWISCRAPLMPPSVLANLSSLVSRVLAQPCSRCGHNPLSSGDSDHVSRVLSHH